VGDICQNETEIHGVPGPEFPMLGPSGIAGCWGIQECLPNGRATLARVDLSLGSTNCDNQVSMDRIDPICSLIYNF
jgi:hypothetical protein